MVMGPMFAEIVEDTQDADMPVGAILPVDRFDDTHYRVDRRPLSVWCKTFRGPVKVLIGKIRIIDQREAKTLRKQRGQKHEVYRRPIAD